MERILALHAWFAADVFARNTEKYQKTHIALNAEQFVGDYMLVFLVFEIQPSFVEILLYFS